MKEEEGCWRCRAGGAGTGNREEIVFCPTTICPPDHVEKERLRD